MKEISEPGKGGRAVGGGGGDPAVEGWDVGSSEPPCATLILDYFRVTTKTLEIMFCLLSIQLLNSQMIWKNHSIHSLLKRYMLLHEKSSNKYVIFKMIKSSYWYHVSLFELLFKKCKRNQSMTTSKKITTLRQLLFAWDHFETSNYEKRTGAAIFVQRY